ncbi:nonstructural protein [Bulbul coronavirus HKU11]|uniref:Nonstructural protein n=2 Tax=Bulbul coronavirus HKU11 TaxID=574549 RepID=B6VDX4_9NIDO|nr:nonstructural protein [Bulbul coronavirus HKU11-934]ACJ12040.1 nonstructural protein [Bulbul coronavirus HKU11-934]ACJ12049.1 nonstructural protein [Bulbul coronavirus HKU11-796]
MNPQKRTKLTYPLGSSHESYVPESCALSIEPCDITTQEPYTPYIKESFRLILEEIAELGTTSSPHAVLFSSEPECKIWKIHWQRGTDCGPGHCITVFQKPGTINWDLTDFTTNSVYTIPLPPQ